MIARFASLLAALLLAVTPTVRAMCDVGCVAVPGRAPAQAAPSHCGAADAEGPSTPGSGDDCGHNHDASQSMVPAPHGPAASALAVVSIAAPPDREPAAVARVRMPAGLPPPTPPSTRPLPLRI